MDNLKIPFQNARIVGKGIDSEAYRKQLPGIDRGHREFVMSRSELMLFASCPSRWFKGYKPKNTDATDFGSLLDCLLMDNGHFEERFARQPETCKATKSMQCVKDGEMEAGADVPWSPTSREAREWKAGQKDKIIVTPDEDADAQRALGRLFGNPKIKALVECSDFQVMVVGEYLDSATGIVVSIKTLLDLVPRRDSFYGNYLADFKTARTAHPRPWNKAIDEKNYDAQAGMFTDLYVAATGEDRNTFLHVVQENTFPFEPDCRMLSGDFLNLGRAKVIGALRDYCQCLAANQWPTWSMERLNGWGVCEPEPYMVSRYTAPLNFQTEESTTEPEAEEFFDHRS